MLDHSQKSQVSPRAQQCQRCSGMFGIRRNTTVRTRTSVVRTNHFAIAHVYRRVIHVILRTGLNKQSKLLNYAIIVIVYVINYIQVLGLIVL